MCPIRIGWIEDGGTECEVIGCALYFVHGSRSVLPVFETHEKKKKTGCKCGAGERGENVTYTGGALGSVFFER